tara:strand:+ start:382 stop:645 length:264 start_codon:yes stop_codon:yes gene_type:complete
MKIFIYKTLFVFILIFIVFHLTFGLAMNQLKKNMSKYFSDENIVVVKEKLREEMRNAIQKENYLKEDDALLLRNFFDKIKKEIYKSN